MANIGDVNDTEFQASVLDSETPVLVDFWAEWCVPCHMVSPVVEEIGQEKGEDLKVAKLNIDENPDATRTYGVMSIPSLILFKAGKEVAQGHRRHVQGRDPARPRSASGVGPLPHTSARAVAVAPRAPADSDRCASIAPATEVREITDIQSRLTALGAAIDGRGARRHVRLRRRRPPSAGSRRERHLQVDGLVGPDTWEQLVEAGWQLGDRTLYHRAPMFRGDDVREIQRMLNALGFDCGKQDGLYGPRTDAALRLFQRNVGDEPDGIVGPHTLSVLRRMRPARSGSFSGARSRARRAESVSGPDRGTRDRRRCRRGPGRR